MAGCALQCSGLVPGDLDLAPSFTHAQGCLIFLSVFLAMQWPGAGRPGPRALAALPDHPQARLLEAAVPCGRGSGELLCYASARVGCLVLAGAQGKKSNHFICLSPDWPLMSSCPCPLLLCFPGVCGARPEEGLPHDQHCGAAQPGGADHSVHSVPGMLDACSMRHTSMGVDGGHIKGGPLSCAAGRAQLPRADGALSTLAQPAGGTQAHKLHAASLHLPQIVDTVDLFHAKRSRKLSLRFLASYLLRSSIQARCCKG